MRYHEDYQKTSHSPMGSNERRRNRHEGTYETRYFTRRESFRRKEMTEEEIRIANKTARSAGAVGKNALLPRIITGKMPYKGAKILDFGSGPRMVQTINLKEQGYNVDAYDFGSNYNPELHIDRSPEMIGSYDIVMASNVINTLASVEAVKETLHQINWFLGTKGVALINYPTSPRKCKGLDLKEMLKLMTREFTSVMVENHSGTRVYYCYKMSQEQFLEEERMIQDIKNLRNS